MDSSQDPPVDKLPTLEPVQSSRPTSPAVRDQPLLPCPHQVPRPPRPCAPATLGLTTTLLDSSSWGPPGHHLPGLNSALTHPPTFSSLPVLHCFPGLFIPCFFNHFSFYKHPSFPPETELMDRSFVFLLLISESQNGGCHCSGPRLTAAFILASQMDRRACLAKRMATRRAELSRER